MESESSSLMACEPYIGSSLAGTPVDQMRLVKFQTKDFLLFSFESK